MREKIAGNQFCIAGLGLVTVFFFVMGILCKFYPFGDSVIMFGDPERQFIPFIEELHRKIFSGESIFHSWNGLYGMDFYSTFAYYLSSPVTLLLALFPQGFVLKTSFFLVLIKYLCVYAAVYYFLVHKRIIRCHLFKATAAVLALAFTISNAMLGIQVAFQYLDCIILLPLVLTGLERIVKGEGFRLYFVTLALTFLCNFYFAFMESLFILLYYFTLKFKSVRQCIVSGVKILGLSVISAGISAVLILPTLASLLSGDDGVTGWPEFSFFENWFQFIQQTFWGHGLYTAGTSLDDYGEANLYVGTFVLLLALLYFGNKKVRVNVRIRKFLLFALMFFSFNTSTFNYVFHLFHMPHGVFNRHIVFFILFEITLAYESINALVVDQKSVRIWEYIILAVISVVLIVCRLVFTYNDLNITRFIIGADVILAAVLALSLRSQYRSSFTYVVSILIFILLDCVSNAGVSYYEFASGYTNIMKTNNIIKHEFPTIVSELKGESGFHNIVCTNMGTNYDNLPLKYGLPSVTGFNSIVNYDYVDKISTLGIYGDGMAYIENIGFDPFTLSFLNVKNTINAKGEVFFEEKKNDRYAYSRIDYYNKKASTDHFKVLENNKTFSPVMTVDAGADKVVKAMTTSSDGTFSSSEVQNRVFHALGGNGNLFTGASLDDMKVDAENCVAEIQKGALVVQNEPASAGSDGRYADYVYHPGRTSYVTVTGTAREDGMYYVGNVPLKYLGTFKKGDKVTYTIPFTRENFKDAFGMNVINLNFQIFDKTRWDSSFDDIASGDMKVTGWTSDTLTGTLHSDRKQYVFSTLAYDKNWNVYIDGKKTNIKSLDGAFLTFEVAPGDHEIELKYRPRYLIPGAVISILCLAGFIAVLATDNKKRRRAA